MAKKEEKGYTSKIENIREAKFIEDSRATAAKSSESETGSKNKPKGEAVKLTGDRDIAYDFATKAYLKFNKIIKSIVLFGSTAKDIAVKKSDIDLIIIIDDCTVQWDQELIAWYREELGKLISANTYKKVLHINTVRLSTWWVEMMRGEPVIINIIRYGETLVDFGGFFNPLKVLLEQGKIKNTPETIYIALQRAPAHMARSKASMINSIEGLYWACVDSAHAALMAAKQIPPSPEHIAEMLTEEFVKKKMLNSKYVDWYHDLHVLTHKVFHGELTQIAGRTIDEWQQRADLFVREMAKITDNLTKEM